MSELASLSVSAFPADEIEAGLTIRQVVSGIIPSCIKMGLLAHELLPYRFERARLGIAGSLLLEVTLWQSCFVVRRSYYKASVFALCGGSSREFVILRSQLWKVRAVGGVFAIPVDGSFSKRNQVTPLPLIERCPSIRFDAE